MEPTEILKKACLAQLYTSCWQGTRQLDAETISAIGNPEWLSGRKHLVNPELIAPIRRVITTARKTLAQNSLPFPIDGLCLISRDAIARVESKLDDLKERFHEQVLIFTRMYQDAREDARGNLNELFSELDYPADIASKFAFNWRYVTIDVPGQNSILTPEIYEREIRKFRELMEEARETAVSTLRYEFAELVEHMTERLTETDDGQPKKFKDSLVNKFIEFFNTFEHRNLFDDRELRNHVQSAKVLLSNISADTLRNNFSTREHVKEHMEKIRCHMADSIVPVPRRRIKLAPAEPEPQAIAV